MKIAWFCIPAHGHTNPSLGLVKELVLHGHQVTYFSFNQFKDKIEETGASFISCDGHDLDMENDPEAGNRIGNDIAFATEIIVKAVLGMDNMLAEIIPQMKPDLIVADSMAFWGKLAAMKYGIPFISSTTTFAFNRYSAKYMDQGIGNLLKFLLAIPKTKKHLKRLQAKGYPVKSVLEIIQNDNDTNTIVYTSKEFQPFAETFSDKYIFVGPSVRPIKCPMEKTANKTIYISMGTVVSNNNIYKNCIEAFRGTDYQVIMSLGETANEFTDLPDNIKIYNSVDQMAVLDIADLFLTHCGMNSASEGLYYEVPLLLYPQTPEQGAVAKRIQELGAGEYLTNDKPEEILNLVEKVLSDNNYKKAAKSISQSFKQSGGVEAARLFIENIQ